MQLKALTTRDPNTGEYSRNKALLVNVARGDNDKAAGIINPALPNVTMTKYLPPMNAMLIPIKSTRSWQKVESRIPRLKGGVAALRKFKDASVFADITPELTYKVDDLKISVRGDKDFRYFKPSLFHDALGFEDDNGNVSKVCPDLPALEQSIAMLKAVAEDWGWKADETEAWCAQPTQPQHFKHSKHSKLSQEPPGHKSKLTQLRMFTKLTKKVREQVNRKYIKYIKNYLHFNENLSAKDLPADTVIAFAEKYIL